MPHGAGRRQYPDAQGAGDQECAVAEAEADGEAVVVVTTDGVEEVALAGGAALCTVGVVNA